MVSSYHKAVRAIAQGSSPTAPNIPEYSEYQILLHLRTARSYPKSVHINNVVGTEFCIEKVVPIAPSTVKPKNKNAAVYPTEAVNPPMLMESWLQNKNTPERGEEVTGFVFPQNAYIDNGAYTGINQLQVYSKPKSNNSNTHKQSAGY